MNNVNLLKVDDYYSYMFDTLVVLDDQQKYIFLTKLYIGIKNKFMKTDFNNTESEIVFDFLKYVQTLRLVYKKQFILKGVNNVKTYF
jgi:hypothetical protein